MAIGEEAFEHGIMNDGTIVFLILGVRHMRGSVEFQYRSFVMLIGKPREGGTEEFVKWS
jgi:hypothetical protein